MESKNQEKPELHFPEDIDMGIMMSKENALDKFAVLIFDGGVSFSIGSNPAFIRKLSQGLTSIADVLEKDIAETAATINKLNNLASDLRNETEDLSRFMKDVKNEKKD